MRRLASIGISLGLALFSLTSFAEAALEDINPEAKERCEAMKKLDRSELEESFKTSKVSTLPDGLAVGCVIGNQRTIGPYLSGFLNKLWRGKVFDAESGTLINSVLREKEKAAVRRSRATFSGWACIRASLRGVR